VRGPLAALFLRDLRLAVRIGGGAMIGVVFFLSVVTIVPFGVGPDMNLLARIGPAILWIGALLATLLGLDRLFQADADDGPWSRSRRPRTGLPPACRLWWRHRCSACS
jgi:heme exporter protein B